MFKVFITILFLTLNFSLISQSKKGEAKSFSECMGAIEINNTGAYSFQFTGTKEEKLDLKNYPSLKDFSKTNLIWVTFFAEEDGILFLDASVNTNYLQMAVFDENDTYSCENIRSGKSEVKRLMKGMSYTKIGLDTMSKEGFLYPIALSSGENIMIAFSTIDGSKATMAVNFKFKVKRSKNNLHSETKIIDNRNEHIQHSTKIYIRDAYTNEPITANITITGTKEFTGLYNASDIYFSVLSICKILIKCDAQGYFFVDEEFTLKQSTSDEIFIYLKRIEKGQSLQINEIQFKPGTSEFLPTAFPKLKRLKDFLASNSEMEIEIQGHVFSTDDNGFASQSMSEARAKKVMYFLIENGIDKKRMTAVGYGNTRPKFAKPKLASEEQANRRVEIVVK
jgi:outer membrane protein OmpA-like peptidoglycan-associated protein